MAHEVVTTRALKVAPRGNLSGVFSVGELTLVVLPKHWRDTRRVVVAPIRGTAVCHELDTLVFRDEAGSPEGVSRVVDGLLGLNREELDEREAPRLVEEIAVSTRYTSAAPTPMDDHALDALLVLFELSLRVMQKVTTLPVLQSHAGPAQSLDNPSETEGKAHLLREVLRAWHLVRLVQARMNDIRRTYLPSEERSKVVRGRILARGLFRSELTGELDCEFEEFSEIAPLYRVVRTTLDLVISDSARWGWLHTLPFADQILEGARGIRRQLAHIAPMPRAEATRVAGQMRLGATLRLWEPVRSLCANILAERPPTDGHGAEGSDTGVALTVNTALLWQGLVNHALHDLRRHAVHLQPEHPAGVALWMGGPFKNKVVDSAVRYRGEHWLIDAKYKDFPESGPPSMGDQYQMFGYSHLYDDVAHVALIYPRSSEAEPTAVFGPHQRGGPARPCTLSWATAPFPPRQPGPDSDQHWDRAVGGVQVALLALLEDNQSASRLTP